MSSVHTPKKKKKEKTKKKESARWLQQVCGGRDRVALRMVSSRTVSLRAT